MTLKEAPAPIPFPNMSLADLPGQLRRLADAYELADCRGIHVVLIEHHDGGATEVFGLGKGTDTGLSLAMAIRARSVLVELLLQGGT